MVKAPYVDKNGLKRGAWSEEEDSMLRTYILRYKAWNWTHIPRFAGVARSAKSCRMRWKNYLKPGLKRGGFSKEEEELILRMQNEHGNKWALIAKSLPGRTDNEIKNYWLTVLSKCMKRGQYSSSSAENASETSEEMHVLDQNRKASAPINISDKSTPNIDHNANPADCLSSIPSPTCNPTLSELEPTAAGKEPFRSSENEPFSSDMINALMSPFTSFDSATITETYQIPEENFWIEPMLIDSSDSQLLPSNCVDSPQSNGVERTEENCPRSETSSQIETFRSLWNGPLLLDSSNTEMGPTTCFNLKNAAFMFENPEENFSSTTEHFPMNKSNNQILTTANADFFPLKAQCPDLENPIFPCYQDSMGSFSYPFPSFGHDLLLLDSSNSCFSCSSCNFEMVTQENWSPHENLCATSGSIFTEPFCMDASTRQNLESTKFETSTLLSHLDSLESFGFWNALWYFLQ